ncbi:MAG: ABC transporter permease [Actinomycetota bacterium]
MTTITSERPRAIEWHVVRETARATGRLAQRQIRSTLRVPAEFIPSMIFPLFFYFVQTGSLAKLATASGVTNYKGFVLPVALLFAVSNEGAGQGMVQDIERGYFDKLLVTPAARLSIVLGAMGGNFARVTFQGLVVTVLAMAAGLRFETGVLGVLPMILLASIWGVAFAALGIGVALRTGSGQATQGAQFLAFPLMFLTTTFAPREALTGWLHTAVAYNPVTYLLEAMRTFAWKGWQFGDVAKGLIAVAVMATITVSFALTSLRHRMR